MTAILAGTAGCSGSTASPTGSSPGTSDASPSSDGLSSSLEGHLIAVQWENRVQVTAATPWELADAATDDASPGDQLHPAWSPDGTHVAYAVDPGDGTRDIWVTELAGGTSRLLHDCVSPCVWTDDPAWSPDGGTVAFVEGTEASDGSGVGTIRTVPIEGGESTVVFTAAPAEYPFALVWSPTGTVFATELVRYADTDVASENVIGDAIAVIADGTATMLTEYDSDLQYPAFDPTGETVLVSGKDELWTVPVAGGPPTKLTDLAADGSRGLQGSYSPDGTVIAFVIEQPTGAAPQIALMTANGGTPELIGPGTHPRIQP